MDSLSFIQIVAAFVVGLTTAVTAISAYLGHRAKRSGAAAEEEEARTTALAPDWDSFTKRQQEELDKLRDEGREDRDGLRAEVGQLRDRVDELSRLHEDDARYIDILRNWIWGNKPPPPPDRPNNIPGMHPENGAM